MTYISREEARAYAELYLTQYGQWPSGGRPRRTVREWLRDLLRPFVCRPS